MSLTITGDTDVCTQAGCDQICIPIPNRTANAVKASCICKAGYTLVDLKKCESKFLFKSHGQSSLKEIINFPLKDLTKVISFKH